MIEYFIPRGQMRVGLLSKKGKNCVGLDWGMMELQIIFLVCTLSSDYLNDFSFKKEEPAVRSNQTFSCIVILIMKCFYQLML